MKKRRCKNKDCKRLFVVSSRNPNQKYCSREVCQRVRMAKWQREKIGSDEDYKMNQIESNDTWSRNNPGYWKKYREKKPDYTKNNREKQKKRDQLKRNLVNKESISSSGNLAKMDALIDESVMISGKYWLIPFNENNLAKMDALTAKVIDISVR